MNRQEIIKELKDVRLISLGIVVIAYILTFGFMMIFASIGLAESEKQAPHAFDNHKFLNYKTFDSLMRITPILGFVILIVIILLFATITPVNKQPNSREVKS